MERYGGLIACTKYMFLQYLILSDSIVLAAMLIGLIATIGGLLMLLGRPPKAYIDILFIVSFVPLCLGIVGTFTTTRNAWDAVEVEQTNYLASSAEKYYDWQYLFTKSMLYSFPALVGLAATLPPLAISLFLKRRIRR